MRFTKLMLSMAAAALMTGACFAQEAVKAEEPKGETNMTTINETIKTIHQRKSVRNYTDQAVTKEQLETLVRAGMAAPTAINTQPWQFVVVTDKNLKADYAKGNMLEP